MEKETLQEEIRQYFIDNPLGSPKEIAELVTKVYKEVRESTVLPYQPIAVERKHQQNVDYNAEIKPVITKGLDDVGLETDFRR